MPASAVNAIDTSGGDGSSSSSDVPFQLSSITFNKLIICCSELVQASGEKIYIIDA